jgi:hypothetical protein
VRSHNQSWGRVLGGICHPRYSGLWIASSVLCCMNSLIYLVVAGTFDDHLHLVLHSSKETFFRVLMLSSVVSIYRLVTYAVISKSSSSSSLFLSESIVVRCSSRCCLYQNAYLEMVHCHACCYKAVGFQYWDSLRSRLDENSSKPQPRTCPRCPPTVGPCCPPTVGHQPFSWHSLGLMDSGLCCPT